MTKDQHTTAPPPDAEWWTPKELAARWRTSDSNIRRRCKDKSLRSMKVGGEWRIHVSTIEEHERDAKPKPSPARKRTRLMPDLVGDLADVPE